MRFLKDSVFVCIILLLVAALITAIVFKHRRQKAETDLRFAEMVERLRAPVSPQPTFIQATEPSEYMLMEERNFNGYLWRTYVHQPTRRTFLLAPSGLWIEVAPSRQ